MHIVDPPIHSGGGSRGIYAHLQKAIEYILKPEKTLGGLYTGSQNCFCQTALWDMINTKRQYGKEPVFGTEGYEHDRLAYHYVLSWKPEENITPEMSLEIAKKFCEEHLSDYEAVYSTHIDKEHIHAHIIFNSVNYKTGRKYRYELNDWEKVLQPLLDRLCAERGLHTLEEDTGKTLAEHGAERRRQIWKKKQDAKIGKKERGNGNHSYKKEKGNGYSFSDYIREDIDTLIRECTDFEEFVQRLQEIGYEIKYGNSQRYGESMALRNKEMKSFRRTYALGEDYTLDMIKSRIAAYHAPLPDPESQMEETYLTAGPVYRCRFYKTENVYLRKQYARMFRLGVIRKNEKRPSYRETMARLKELRRLEYQLELIAENDYLTADDIKEDISVREASVKELKNQIKDLQIERRPYEKMLTVYERMEELEGAFLLFEEGDPVFGQESKEYLRLLQESKSFPHSREELKEYMNRQAIKERRAKRKLREEQQKLKAVISLREEYDQVMMEYAPADDMMMKKMEQQGMEKEPGKRKKRKEL